MLQMLEQDIVRSPVPKNSSEHHIAADILAVSPQGTRTLYWLIEKLDVFTLY